MEIRPLAFALLLGLLSFGMVSCTTLPQQGPTTNKIVSQSENKDFLLVEVTSHVANILAARRVTGFGSSFVNAGSDSSSDVVSVGDILNIQIYEAQEGSLFGESGSDRGTRFQAIQVDKGGSILIPFAGEIQVEGLTARQIQNRIVERLSNLAIQPQALVTIRNSQVNTVTLAGSVGQPGKQTLDLGETKLVDVLAQRGGSRFPAFETDVTISRNGRTATALLSDIYANSRQNISLRRGDLIVLSQSPKSVTVLGSVSRVGNVPLRSSDVNLLEILGDAGGLSDARADRGGVFIFRYERAHFLGHLGFHDLTGYRTQRNGVPTVYRVDFGDANAQFFARSFRVQPNDSIYVANSDSVQLGKFFELLGLGSDSARDIIAIENSL